MDRNSDGPLLVGSPFGGTSIEDVAASNPDAIFTSPISITDGITDTQVAEMAVNLGLDVGTPAHDKAKTLMKNIYKMFTSCDCTQLELNPVAETPDGDVVVCDAKINYDDNAAFRQGEIHAGRDMSQEDPREVEASKYVG